MSSASHAAMFFSKPKEPSDAFDGFYTFSHNCFSKKTGEPWPGDWYDGSRFIIKEGKVSNNRGGAGRYTIDVESRIDKQGTIYIKGKRKNHNFKSDKEMFDLFIDLPEALLNNYYLPYKCNFKTNNSKPLLPEISSDKDMSSDEILQTQALKGLEDNCARDTKLLIKTNKFLFLI